MFEEQSASSIMAFRRLVKRDERALEELESSVCLFDGKAIAVHGDGPGGEIPVLREALECDSEPAAASPKGKDSAGGACQLETFVKLGSQEDVRVEQNLSRARHR
jgi:hypothetical protein